MTPVFLVTGAAGFIGSHSVEWLLRRGWQVVGVDNLRTGRLDNLAGARSSPNFTLVIADAGDEAAMRPLFQQHRFAGALHLAALVSVPESFREPEINYRLNLATADALARLCLEFDCKRLVFASSAAIYGASATLPNRESALPQPQSPYAAAKLAAEVMLLGYAANYGLEAVCLRYFNVYGPRQDPGSPYSVDLHQPVPTRFAGDGVWRRRADPGFHLGSGCGGVQRASPLTRQQDVVGGRCNVCTGHAISLKQVLAIYHELFPGAPPAEFASGRIGDIRHSLGDPALLQDMLQFSAQTPFAQGLRELVLDHD